MFLSLVIPCYNEQEVLPLTLNALGEMLGRMGVDYEIIFINDGSTDGTLALLTEAARRDRRIKILGFSRNFGHQIAITAGIDFAQGEAVVVMDADLQDPPEILAAMVEHYRQGYDIVSAQRISRQGDSLYKQLTAGAFYWLMRKAVDERLVPEVGDFRLFSRGAILALRQLREQHRFMRGMVAWLGLKEKVLPFERHTRAAGVTKYPTWKMLRFAWTAITSFSGLPLRMSLLAGVGLTTAGLLYIAWAAYSALILKTTVPGWTSLIFIQILFSGAILIAIGLVGDYLSKVYEELKQRPLYVLRQTCNIDLGRAEVPRAFVMPEALQQPLGNAEIRIQNTESRIQNSESRIQNPESGIQNPESRIQNSESGIQNPESGIQNSDSQLTTHNAQLTTHNPEKSESDASGRRDAE